MALHRVAVIVLITLSSSLSLGCRADRGNGSVSGRHVPLESRALNSLASHPHPIHVALAGDFLIVGGPDPTALLHVFDRRSGDLRTKAGLVGPEMGERSFIGSLQVVQRGELLYASVFDPFTNRLLDYRVVPDSGLALHKSRSYAPPSKWFEGVYWLTESTLLALPAFSETRAWLLTKGGIIKRHLGKLPSVGPEIPLTAAYQMFEPIVAVDRQRRSFAMAARYAGRIDIFLGDTLDIEAEVPVPFPPVIDVRDNGAIDLYRLTRQTIHGYVAMAASSTRLYALFSGRTMAGCRGCAEFGRQVHVFDWTGKLRDIISLEYDAIAIAVSEDDTHLYSVSPSRTKGLREYRIEKEWSGTW